MKSVNFKAGSGFPEIPKSIKRYHIHSNCIAAGKRHNEGLPGYAAAADRKSREWASILSRKTVFDFSYYKFVMIIKYQYTYHKEVAGNAHG